MCTCITKKFICFYYAIIILLRHVSTDYLRITDLVSIKGYPIESYEVQTADGYILKNFRIPYGRNSTTNTTNRHPVLLMHGMQSSSEAFILNDSGLGYTLADNGYDVWLCNSRGNYHSRKHTCLDADTDSDFWKFSFHEIGVFDIPASIDHILNITKKTKLHYVGYSQGATAFFVMGSERPEYNEKIKIMIALAPPVFFTILHKSFHLIAPLFITFDTLVDTFNLHEVIPHLSSTQLNNFQVFVCDCFRPISNVCKNIVAMATEGMEEQIDESLVPLIAATQPAGGSIKQVAHFLQVAASGRFQKYNWGIINNLKKYGSSSPPEYNMKKVIAPVAIFYSEDDHVVGPKGVLRLAEALPNVVELYKVSYKNWTHLDFIWAKDVSCLLYKRVLEVMMNFTEA